MLIVKYSGKMKKDLKTCLKRNCDFSLLEKVITKLQIPGQLEEKNKEHNLSGDYGDYSGFRECHISPDWLLIYRQTEKFLELYRSGTHSDLFR